MRARQQAREGYTSITPLAPIEKLKRPEIHFSGRGAPYAEMMQHVAETLDWPALEATMR